MATANFKELIIALSGDIADDGDAQKWVLDGCYDVINRLKTKDPQSLFRMCVVTDDFGTSSATNNGIELQTEMREIIRVERDKGAGSPKTCRPVSPGLRDEILNNWSIHYASDEDPAFYILSDKLYILPAAVDTSGLARFYFIPQFVVTSFDGTTTLGINVGDTDALAANNDADFFPREYYDHVILYAAIQNLERRLNDYLEDDEDVELINGAQAQLATMKQKYEAMYGGA